LTPDELADLRREMIKSSEWMRAELGRRRLDGGVTPSQLSEDASRGRTDDSSESLS